MTKYKEGISIIIVTYKSEAHIKALLDSIFRSVKKVPYEVIIIDNYLRDNTLKIASSHPIKSVIIENPNNPGFAKSVNDGIKRSNYNYIFLLNPDTVLVGNCLSSLYDYAKANQNIGAVVPRLLDPNNKKQPSAYRLPSITNALKYYFLNRKTYFGKYLPTKRVSRVDAAVMAAFLLPHSVIDKIGYLDERFFLYYEDVEYCRRLLKFHLPINYLSYAKVKHIHGASGHFVSHLNSPLARSARTYHGNFYFSILTSVLWFGQKWQKLMRTLHIGR